MYVRFGMSGLTIPLAHNKLQHKGKLAAKLRCIGASMYTAEYLVS